MTQRIRSAAVLGAGTMGSQIAAHLANQGIPCLLLDVVPPGAATPEERGQVVRRALENLRQLKPAPLASEAALKRITPGNFEDDLHRLKDADWIVEAVVEKLDIKQQLWSKVAAHVRDDAILSSNTSGIPIHHIARALPEPLRRRFLGTHFFNPPRYLYLLEVIPTPQTDPGVVETIAAFAERVLGKGVVFAKDTPNFIANRIGTFGMMETLRVMEEMGLRADEVDAVTGPPMGRPKSATFRTLDLVGIDVFALVADNLHQAAPEAWERDAFALPPLIRRLMERGALGEKTRQGFYKRVKMNGETEILVLDPETMEYVPRRRLDAPSLAMVRGMEDARERLRYLVGADDKAGRFAWEILKRTLLYTARVAEQMADDIVSIDNALRWGFGWELGPFEAWDAVGLAESVRRMENEGAEVPAWVARLAESDAPSFYALQDGQRTYATFSGGRAPVPERPRTFDIALLKERQKVIHSLPGATLCDIGDDVALVDFHSPKQAIGADLIQMLHVAMQKVRDNFRGLVISSHVLPNFCVGANLAIILMAAQEGDWDEVDLAVRQFQTVNQALKYFERPVVVAPYGMTLGGGAELCFAGDRVVAAFETYIGLVEVGAGLIPAGGGCKEMLVRAMEGTPGLLEGEPRGAMHTAVDPQPLINKVFETIGTAKVSTSAPEGQQLGYLRKTDRIVANQHHLWYEAKQAVLALDAAGYKPPAPPEIPVLGPDGRAVLELGAQQLFWSGYATEYDLHIARKLAYVLTGGDVPAGTRVSEQYLLDLERQEFLSLCGNPKTQARMQHILKTGKPLRN